MCTRAAGRGGWGSRQPPPPARALSSSPSHTGHSGAERHLLGEGHGQIVSAPQTIAAAKWVRPQLDLLWVWVLP